MKKVIWSLELQWKIILDLKKKRKISSYLKYNNQFKHFFMCCITIKLIKYAFCKKGLSKISKGDYAWVKQFYYRMIFHLIVCFLD